MSRIKLKDEAAFELMVNRYQSAVYSFANRVMRDHAAAYDVTQETFLALLTKAGTFISGCRVRPWLFKIAHNKCRDYIRHAGVVTSEIYDQVEFRSPEHLAQENLIRRKLSDEVGALRSEERDAIVMRHQADLSYDEIACAMAIPIGTVKTHLFRARNRLRGRLSDLQEGL